MKKIISIILLINLCFINSSIAFADIELSSNSYTSDGKIKIYSTWYGNNDTIYECEISMIDKFVPKQTFYGVDDKKIEGTMLYPNYSDVKAGMFDLQWIFTPDSDIYETKTGVFHFKLIADDYNEPILSIDSMVNDATVSLTTASLMLAADTSYDINLENKEENSSYYWKSSNTKVAKVNSKNGFVTAVSDGTASITCTVTYADGTTDTLYSNVTVGLDDNLPVLTDTSLDLSVGDKYTIKAENVTAKSKYKFTSSDKTVVIVSTTSGRITAISPGDAYIICTITAPDNQIIVLRCDVSVTK